MKGCKNCIFNQLRTLHNKECQKGHKAVYGPCKDYEPKNIDKYDIGYQLTIFDLMNDEQERSN